MDLARVRREYLGKELRRASLAPSPLAQFDDWFAQAQAEGVVDPNAMVLCTVDTHGQPSSRTVLLKQRSDTGFVFYTDLQSRKARNLASHPRASLTFHWPALFRQVHVAGQVSSIGREAAQEYWATRPRESQLAAFVSDQSRVLDSRKRLEDAYEAAQARFADQEIPLPEEWGGYVVVPDAVEFWQGRERRLHDRFLYTWAGDEWRVDRLWP